MFREGMFNMDWIYGLCMYASAADVFLEGYLSMSICKGNSRVL